MIIINRDDYFNWSNDYKREFNLLNEKIKEKEKLLESKTVKNRGYHQYALGILHAMKNDCLRSYGILRRKAESME